MRRRRTTPNTAPSASGSPGFRRYAATVAVFATALFVALVIAVFGVISLLENRPVIAHAGELVGPVAVTAATLLVCGCLLLRALRIPESRQRIAPLTALAVGVAAYFAYALFGAGADLMGVDPVDALTFLGVQLLSPFALAVGVIAFVITVLYMLVLASRLEQRGRPLWPWEKDDDE